MIINSINTESIVPVEYNHMHDDSLVFRKYKENFDFGLTVDQYYFNKDARDRKTNYNTQYVLSDLQSLSTVLELKIPHTAAATRTFTTTVKFGEKYLKTNFQFASAYTTGLSTLSSTFVDSSEFTNLSSHFFFTFTLTSVSLSSTIQPSLPFEERVIVTQEFNSATYYLTANESVNAQAWFTPYSAVSADIPTFRYNLENNKIIITNSTPTLSTIDGRFCNSGDVLKLSAIDTFFGEASALSACIFDVNRHELTKDYKTLPSSYVKYISSYNTDTVDLNTSTITEQISNNFFVYSNNYNFFQQKKNNINSIHADIFPLKNQATLHEYYAENNHFNSEPAYLNRVYEKIHAGTNQQTGQDKIGVSYNIGTYDTVFKPNKLTYFTTPNSLAPYTALNIKDSKLQNLGSVPGDNPLMSDKVFKRREDIKSNSYSNNTDPTYLCSWLSGNQDGETKWVDRYYNPSVQNFTRALSTTSFYKVVTAAGAETTETFDVSSSLTFEPNNDYMIYHIGNEDYANLFKAFDTQYNQASAIEYINFKGVPTSVNKVLDDDEITFDGETFGRIKTDTVGDFSTSFWLNTKNNTLPFGYQILGNLAEEGFGVFNTDLVTPNIILPVTNEKTGRMSKLLFLNNDFETYDEVVLRDGVEEIDIQAIGRKDNFSEFYVLGTDNIIYVFNSNNNLVSKIEDIYIANNPNTLNEPKNNEFTSSVSGTYADCQDKWSIAGHSDIQHTVYDDWDLGEIQFDGGLYAGAGAKNYSGWRWNNGIAEHVVNSNNTALSADNLYQDVGTVLGEEYIVELEISDRTAGDIRVFLGTFEPQPPRIRDGLNTNGFHSVKVKATINTPQRLFIQASHDFVGKVDNINLKRVIQQPIIDDFEVGEDRLHVLFNPVSAAGNFFTYNYDTNKSNTVTNSVTADTIGAKGKIVRRNEQTYIYSVDSANGYGNEISFDSAGKAYVVRQDNQTVRNDTRNHLQKDAHPLSYGDTDRLKAGLGIKAKINGTLVDDEDNIIVLHDNNFISILDNNRILKRTREFCDLNNQKFQQTYIDLIYDFEGDKYKKYILLIQEFVDGFRLTKLDDKLRIVHTRKFYGSDLGDLKLTKSVTSYYYLRNTGANKARLKVQLKAKPKYSSSGVIPRIKNTIDFDITTLNSGYNHFFVNVSMRKGFMELFVNGKKYQRVSFDAGAFALDNVLGTGMYVGAVSTPFYLTLANRLLQPKKYFLNSGSIKGFKLYNKTMSYFDMLAHYNYHIGDKDLIWSYPLGQRTYIDTIDKLSKFSFPEKINNDYKVNIVNTNIKDNKLKDKITERIEEELIKITPYYDNNQEINIT